MNERIRIPKNEKSGMSKEELLGLVEKWQKKLKMDDWKIGLEIVEFEREDGFKQSGDFEADWEKKEAVIFLTWEPFLEEGEEKTLLHELVHVLIWDLDEWICEKQGETDEWLERLEKMVDDLVEIFWGMR